MTSIRFYVVLFLFLASFSHGKLIILNENNWDQMLNGEWMVEFYAPWCPACRALEPVWEDFASWADDLGIKVAHVDVTTSPGLSGRFMVTALPTIYHVKGGVFRQYRGTRDKDEFMSFVEEKKYEQVEPIPSWKSPASAQMSIVSGFFKLSMLLRNIHTQITEEYGIPYWGSYLLFAVATIVIGAVLGLVLVFLIDCFYPSKVSTKKTIVEVVSDNDQQDGDDIVDEESGSGSEFNDDESEVLENEKLREVTEEEEEESEEKEKSEAAEGGSSSPDVRRRRTRKAD